MNRSSVVAFTSLLVALFAVVTALFAVFRPDVGTEASRGVEMQRDSERETQALLVHMVLYQRYAEKAHDAAAAANWPLATFYAEEIQENSERLIDSGITINKIDISQIAAEVALPRAQRLVAAARSGQRARFDSTYALMLDGCNACHKRSGHRYVQIQAPAAPGAYPSQSFAPIPGLRPE